MFFFSPHVCLVFSVNAIHGCRSRRLFGRISSNKPAHRIRVGFVSESNWIFSSCRRFNLFGYDFVRFPLLQIFWFTFFVVALVLRLFVELRLQFRAVWIQKKKYYHIHYSFMNNHINTKIIIFSAFVDESLIKRIWKMVFIRDLWNSINEQWVICAVHSHIFVLFENWSEPRGDNNQQSK